MRAEVDLRNEKINYKVREHSLAKVPVMLVVGKREAEEKTVSIRRLGSQAQETLPLAEAIKRIAAEAVPPDSGAENASQAEGGGVGRATAAKADGRIALQGTRNPGAFPRPLFSHGRREGTHHASTPANRFEVSPGRRPFSVTIPSWTSTAVCSPRAVLPLGKCATNVAPPSQRALARPSRRYCGARKNRSASGSEP